jgi:16S rRNA processing protein RimM
VGEAPERIVVGRIVKPHALKGELIVEVMSDAPERFARGSVLEAGDPAVPSGRRRLTVRSTRDDRGKLLVSFKEVPDRTAADALHGQLLSIAAEDAAPLTEGAYYDWQLEGLTVMDEEGATLGTLVRVDRSAGPDHWIVEGEAGEVMVPAVEEFIRSVDLDEGTVVVRPIPGLFG